MSNNAQQVSSFCDDVSVIHPYDGVTASFESWCKISDMSLERAEIYNFTSLVMSTPVESRMAKLPICAMRRSFEKET